MIPTRNEDRSLFDKRKIQQNRRIHADKALGQERASQALGQWMGGQFKFASPEAENQWRREAYRQAVHPDDWHKGDPIDPQTLELIEAGAAGKTPPHFRGPDGQHRFSSVHTIEPAEVRAIRARNFDGKTLEEVSAANMPGEDEAVRYAGAGRGRARSAARPNAQEDVIAQPANDPSATNSPAKPVVGAGWVGENQQPKQPDPVLLADSSAVPLLPKGLGTSPAAAPRPMGGVEPWNPGGKIPASKSPNTGMSPANDNVKPGAAPESPGPRVSDPQSTFSPTTPPGSAPMTPSSGESSPDDRKSSVDRAVERSISEQHGRWVERVMADPRSEDPIFVADEATLFITFDLPFVIDTYRNLPEMEAYRTITPLDIELLRGGYTQQVIDLFPEQSRAGLQKAMDTRPKILTSGPAGLSDVLEAMQQGEITGFAVDGQSIPAKGRNPDGAAGSKEIQDFNMIVADEAKKLVDSCKEVEGQTKHTAGKGSEKPESWIQFKDKLSTNLGSRRIDVTVYFTINGQPCTFQINTADTAVANLFTEREWRAIEDAAKMMQGNTADAKFASIFADRLTAKVISQFNAFFMIGKPKKGERSLEAMRKLAQDTLGLISCSEIELACKGNLVINKRPRP